MPETRVELTPELTTQQVARALELVSQVSEVEGVGPLSEHVLLQLRDGGNREIRHVLLWSNDALVGYAQLDLAGATAEFAAPDPAHVHPLVEAVVAEAGDRLQMWAHGEKSGVAHVLRELGYRGDRVLLQLRRSLTEPLPEPTLPERVTVRTFIVGQDEQAWLAVNNLAFADHPEQSGWITADIEQREREPWFDPAGFFLAERDGALVGFHWTKVHAGDPATGSGPIGEVYVVGVSPTMQGQHLGSALTVAGLSHLRQQGLDTAMLYVDESNTAALKVYEKLGFTRWDADVLFQR